LQTPDSSPFSLLHSPLSSSKYWTLFSYALHALITSLYLRCKILFNLFSIYN
jgi:hypothetical protein